MGEIRVGVAGWDYPDWNGIVYPTRPGSGFDRLAYLAGFVDTIEVNSSFYRPLDPHQTMSWVRRTRINSRFRFTAKAHRSWTHDSAAIPAEVVPETLAGLAPLRSANVLGAILVQFPQRFHRSTSAFEHLDSLLELLDGWPVVAEVRHASWDHDDVAPWFERRNIGWCVVDQPRVGRSTVASVARSTSRVGYVRLHGRNAANWFRTDAGRDERYDYLYSGEELAPLAAAAREISERTEELYVVQNNHFRGQALANALQMRHLIEGGSHPAPPDLLRAYPELETVTSVDQGRLF
ncbi:MAG: DUF72 domain-containing protein [Acidobacteriota bacterium]|nr:DUF72 domain-containing protein [Acidobacteriota bacterium]